MKLEDAQNDVRDVYMNGFVGPLVSSIIWLASAGAYQWSTPALAMATLFFGGAMIFPLSTLLLKLVGSKGSLPKGHPSNALATQSALTVPFGFIVTITLGITVPALFFPASLIIVGAHYLPFMSLYGLKFYGVLAGSMIGIGAATIFIFTDLRETVGWIGGAVLLAAAVYLYVSYKKSLERK